MKYDVARVDGSGRTPAGTDDVKVAANVARRSAMAPGNTGRYVVLESGNDRVAVVVWPDGGADFFPPGLRPSL